MPFLETADLASAPSFRARMISCLVKVAAGVKLEEDDPELMASYKAKRKTLATNVSLNPAAYVDTFIWGVLADADIATAGLAATDAQIEERVCDTWDQISGVTDSDIDPAALLPQISFTSTADGQTVEFISQTTRGVIDGWHWDFGDTIGVTTENASHHYAQPGTYTVTLIAYSEYGTASYSHDVTVVADE